MKYLHFLLLLIICSGNNLYAQNYDKCEANLLISKILYEKKPDTAVAIYIAVDFHKSLLISERRKSEYYKGLVPYADQQKLNNLLDYCIEISSSCNLRDFVLPDIELVDSVQIGRIVAEASNKTIYLDKKKRVVKTVGPKKSRIFKFSPPIFFDDRYCLIKVSTTSANTSGSTCLYLYEKVGNVWKQVEIIQCSYS